MTEKRTEDIINQTKNFTKKELSGEASGHDWWHAYRVWNNSKLILKSEPSADKLTVEVAALLHDIADHKFHDGNTTVGSKVARKFLKSIKVDDKTIDQVCDIISTLSYKGAKVKTSMKTIEGEIVQDADRLDAIGAIGIARAFAYAGFSGEEMHDPEVKPKLHSNFDEYKNSKSTTINHFYEKLLLLKDKMNTESAKRIAASRQSYMEGFLDKFNSEWEGQS